MIRHMASARFPARVRLRKRADFARVYLRRCSVSDALLLIFVDSNGLTHPRLGLSVSRKVGNAVRRNRWKRLLREAFRLSQGQLSAGLDIILIPRPAADPVLAQLLSRSCAAVRGQETRQGLERRWNSKNGRPVEARLIRHLPAMRL